MSDVAPVTDAPALDALERAADVPSLTGALERLACEIRTDTERGAVAAPALLDTARRALALALDHASLRVRRHALSFLAVACACFECLEDAVNADVDWVAWSLHAVERRARTERDDEARTALVHILERVSMRVKTMEAACAALEAFETFARDEDATNAAKAMEALAAMTHGRNVGAFDREKMGRRCDATYWAIHSTCLCHRKSGVRAAAARACGGLVAAAFVTSYDSRAFDSYSAAMARMCLDTKPVVVRGVCESVASVFIARINSGLFTVRPSFDSELLCVMFICAAAEDNLLRLVQDVNAAHSAKMMNECFRSITLYVLDEMLDNLQRNTVWREDARSFELRAAALALIIEHVGNRIAPFTARVIKTISMETDDKTTPLEAKRRVVKNLLTYAPETRQSWIEAVEESLHAPEEHSVAEITEIFLAFEIASAERSLLPRHAASIAEMLLRCGDLVSTATCTKIIDALLTITNEFVATDEAQKAVTALKALAVLNASAQEDFSTKIDAYERTSQVRFYDEVEADEVLTRIEGHFHACFEVDAGAWERLERALTAFYKRLVGRVLSARVMRTTEQVIDIERFDGTSSACLSVKCYMRAFLAYCARDGKDAQFASLWDFLPLMPVLDSLLTWLQWRPGEAVATLRDIAAACIAHFSCPKHHEDEPNILTCWLSRDNRTQRTLNVLLSMDLDTDEKMKALRALRRAACAADRKSARAHQEKFAIKHLSDLSKASTERERERAAESFADVLDDLNSNNAYAGNLVERVFLFADDQNEEIRRHVRRMLERAKMHYPSIVQQLVSSEPAKLFVHTDGLEGLRDVCPEDGW